MPDLLLSFPVSQLGAQMTPLNGVSYFTVLETSTVKAWAIADKAAVIAAYEADPNFGGWISLDGADDTRQVLFASSIVGTGSPAVDTFASGVGFTGGVTTSLVLSGSPLSVNNLVVLFDGVQQQKATMSLAGTTLTFTSPIPLGVSIVEVTRNPTSTYPTVADQSITMGKLAVDVMPAGVMLPYAGAAAPSANWMLCIGTSLLRASYPALFAAIGTAYGAADGTHFSLPDMRGRTVMGAGTGTYSGASARTVGQAVGEETHVLTIPELAAHTHGNTLGAGHSTTGGGGGVSEANPTSSTPVTASTGSDGAHNNMQPSLGCNFIIKVV